MEDTLLKKWEGIASRYDDLTHQLSDPSVLNQPALLHKVNKERMEIEQLAQDYARFRDLRRQLAEVELILSDPAAGADMKDLAAEEGGWLKQQLGR